MQWAEALWSSHSPRMNSLEDFVEHFREVFSQPTTEISVHDELLRYPSKMAAHSDAAATPGPKNGVFMSVSLVSSSSNCLTLLENQKTNTRKHIYDRQSLLDIDNVYKHQLSPATTEKLQGLCLLLKPDPETAASPTDATRTKRRRRRCERGQKRGKRGGIRARLRANPTSPAIPSLMLSNVRSLENKLDLIQLSRSTQHETVVCLFSLKHG